MKKLAIAIALASTATAAIASPENDAIANLEMILVDPDSLKVRSTEMVEICDHSYVEVVYNARNRMGGYNGYESHLWNPRTDTWVKSSALLPQNLLSNSCTWKLSRLGDETIEAGWAAYEAEKAAERAAYRAELKASVEEYDRERQEMSTEDFLKKVYGE